MKSLEQFFNPSSVAVIGASNSPFNLGSTICKVLKEYLNFSGNIYAVNRKGENVFGCAGFHAVEEIPGDVDLAVIITPAGVVPGFVRDCGRKGIKNIIIESAGFSEAGDAGTKMQEEMDGYRREYGLRIMGPNCLGVLNAHAKFCCFYGFGPSTMGMMSVLLDKPGTISYIIQSGGIGVVIMESFMKEVVSINKMVSIGNKTDIDEADLVDYFKDDGTEVIGMYLENINDGRKFINSVKRLGKPVLVYKVGKTAEGARAAMSHTAGMASNDVIFDSACRQSGIIRLKSISELHSMPKIFTSMPILNGKNIAIFTNSGAFGGITSDLLVEAGLSIPRLSADTQEKLSRVGQIFNVSNPIDLGPALSPQIYIDIFDILLSAPEVDGLLPVPSIWQPFVIDALDELVKMCKKYGKPAAIYTPNSVEKIITTRKERQIPLFESPEEAVRALQISYQYGRHINKIKQNV